MKSSVYLIVKAVIFSILCFLSKQTIAQVDSLHYIPPMYSFNPGDVGKHQIVLTTSETEEFTVTITNANGDFTRVVNNLSAVLPQKVDLGTGFAAQGIIDTTALNTSLRTEGLIISGPKKFFVSIQQRSSAQGDFLSSKGTTALGMDFYSGHMAADSSKFNKLNGHFISVMATENNTNVTFNNSRIKFKGQSQNFFTISLKKNESYVIGIPFNHLIKASIDLNDVNGTHITSNKPIAVNSGSWSGSGNPGGGRDVGFDQIVPTESIGKEYILIKGEGLTKVGKVDKPGAKYNERAIIIATEANTKITYQYNDSTSNSIKIISKTLQKGQYHITQEDEFVNSTNGNLYINADKKIFVYQTLSGANERQTAGFCFIPPLKCTADKEVTIAFTNELAGSAVKPILKLITQAGSTVKLNNVIIDPKYRNAVIGNSFWETYNIPNLELVNPKYNSGSNSIFKIESTGALNAMLAVRSGNVGAGGFYSGFGDIPEIEQNPEIESQGLCGNNVQLTAVGFDSYNWYKDGLIVAANGTAIYEPLGPGRYKVTGVSPCGNTDMESFPSNEIRILPCLSVTTTNLTVTEGTDLNAVFRVELSHPWLASDNVDVTFDYQTIAGTAAGGLDYIPQTGNVTISSGETFIDIEIPIVNDILNESNEQFTLTITNVAEAVGSVFTGTCTIDDDNDTMPVVSVSDQSFDENSGTVLIPIDLNIASGKIITVDYTLTNNSAIYPFDFTAVSYSGSLDFEIGEKNKNIPITIIDDNIYEPGLVEKFTIVLNNVTNATNGNLNADISIVDNESISSISIANASAEEGSDIVYQAVLSNVADVDVSFDYAISLINGQGKANQQDFINYASFSSGTVTIPAGDLLVDFPNFITKDDNANEQAETFSVNFSNVSNATLNNASANGTIVDNEGDPTLSIGSASGDEGNILNFTISVSPINSTDINFEYRTVNGTAESLVDFTGMEWSNITLLANQSSVNLPISSLQDTDEEGIETFTVEIRESLPQVEIASGLNIATGTILDDDDTPDARADNYSVDEDNVLSDNVMTNDLGFGDPPVRVSSNTDPANGDLVINSDGSFTYTPTPQFNGSDSFQYTIRDIDKDESTAKVTITVKSIDDVPVANDDTYTIEEDTRLNADVTSNDQNMFDLPIKITMVSNVNHGVLTLNLDGTFSYMPSSEYFGSDNFTYRLTDGNGDAVIANVDITINFINDGPPVAENDNISTNEDTPVTIDILANDTDIDGNETIDKASVLIKTGPSDGVLSQNFSTAEVTYSPNHNYTGSDSFIYTIQDASGSKSNEARVSITVTVDNDPPVAICKSGVVINLDTDGEYTLKFSDIDDGSYDVEDGSIESFSISPNILNCSHKGSVEVTLTVTDKDLASTTCSTTITVVDNISPTIKTAQADISVPADTGTCGAIVNYASPIFTDNCDGDQNGTLIAGSSSGSNFEVGTTIVTFEYTDASGNGPVQSSFSVTVTDNQYPLFNNTSNRNFIPNNSGCQYLVSGTDLDVTATDNCGIKSFSHNYDRGGTSLDGKTFGLGTTDVTWTAEDIHGNIITKMVQVVIGSSLSVTLEGPPGNIVCGDDEDPTFIINATGGTLSYHYEFIIEGEVILKNISENEYIISNLISGDRVKVKVTDANGCQVESNEITMTVYPKLSKYILFN